MKALMVCILLGACLAVNTLTMEASNDSDDDKKCVLTINITLDTALTAG